jgi:hypothetical protein
MPEGPWVRTGLECLRSGTGSYLGTRVGMLLSRHAQGRMSECVPDRSSVRRLQKRQLIVARDSPPFLAVKLFLSHFTQRDIGECRVDMSWASIEGVSRVMCKIRSPGVLIRRVYPFLVCPFIPRNLVQGGIDSRRSIVNDSSAGYAAP